MDNDKEKELLKRRINTWKKAAPELERIRMVEIRNADTEKAIIALNGPFQSTMIHYKPRPSSGLVEQQKLFKKFYERTLSTRC